MRIFRVPIYPLTLFRSPLELINEEKFTKFPFFTKNHSPLQLRRYPTPSQVTDKTSQGVRLPCVGRSNSSQFIGFKMYPVSMAQISLRSKPTHCSTGHTEQNSQCCSCPKIAYHTRHPSKTVEGRRGCYTMRRASTR